jgi:hypothetical protein
MDEYTDADEGTDYSGGDDYGSDGGSEEGSDAGTSTGAEDASFVHPPSEWGQRVGQFWSGVGDWAEGTASSVVHLGEYAYDSATGDDEAAKRREGNLSQDWDQITHGVQEIADLM